ncbi:MAG: ABC-2 transporter permease [Bryobacteraceae bacterium]
MSNSVTRALILKDWALQRTFILLSIAGGVIALAVLQVKNDTAFMVGAVWFFVALILLATMVPMANVINERKKQNLAFLMSLPLSATQYGMSKFVSSLGMFLAPWAVLVIAASTSILSHREVPHGIIPLMLILFVMPLVGFCFVAGAALIGEGEGWAIAATIVCNSSYGLAWTLIIRNPVINGALKSPVAVWSSPVRMILGGEVAAIVLILAITFYVQSRKRDFV